MRSWLPTGAIAFHEKMGGTVSELDNPIYGRYITYLDHNDFVEARDDDDPSA